MAATKVALTGKMLRGRIDFSASAFQQVSLAPIGRLAPGDYSIVGLPLVRARDRVTIAVARNLSDYTVSIRGRRFTVTSDGTATVTEIRDLLNTAITAALTALKLTITNQGADAFDLESTEAGLGLDIVVTGPQAGDITLLPGINDNTGRTPVGVVAKRSGKFDVRAVANISAGFEFTVIG